MASTPSDSVSGDLNNLKNLKKFLAGKPKQTKHLKSSFTMLHGNTVYQMLRPEYEKFLRRVSSPGHFEYIDYILNEVSAKYPAAEENISSWNQEDFQDALKLLELESIPDFPGQAVLEPVYAASIFSTLPSEPCTEELQALLLYQQIEEEEAAKSRWRRTVESACRKIKWHIRARKRWITTKLFYNVRRIMNRIKSLK